MFHHIPALKFEPSPDANNPEEFLLYNVRIVHWTRGCLGTHGLVASVWCSLTRCLCPSEQQRRAGWEKEESASASRDPDGCVREAGERGDLHPPPLGAAHCAWPRSGN